MKNFNYHGGSLKNPICRGGHEKAIYRGNNCLKMGGGGLGQFADLRRRLGKKERGGVFKGGVPIGKIKSSLFHCFHFLKKSPNNKNE